VQKGGSEELGLAQAREVATSLGAGLMLLGAVVEGGGRLQLTATLYGSTDGARASVQSQSDDEAQLFKLVDQLAREILGTVHTGPGMRFARLAGRMTGSLPALKAYLEGERCLRQGRYFDALDLFQRASTEDSGFALGYYHLAAAAAGCAQPELARQAIEQAHAHRHRLAEHDRLLLDAQYAWLMGEVMNAESLYNAITTTYPDDIEAWFHLGDMLFHCNPLRGRSAAESRGAFERILGYEPDHLASLVHLMRVAAIERRHDQALDLARRVRALSPAGDQSLALEAFVAFAAKDERLIERVIQSLRHARAVTVAVAFSDVALYSGNPDGAECVARAFIEVARSSELRALCHVGIAHIALSQGRYRAARAELAAAQALDYPQALETRALFAALPFVPVDEGELSELREQLRLWDPSEVVTSGIPALAVHNLLHPALQEYLLGLLAVRAGDLAEARHALGRLSAQADGTEPAARAALRRGLAASVARVQSGPGGALSLLGTPRVDLWFQVTVVSPFLSLAHERFLRAELLHETGRDAEALGWYGSIAERSPYELIYAAPAHLRRGEIFALQGDHRAARAEHEQLHARWGRADAELQPMMRPAVS
jgi:tetratricopeptide (TPR) repeat protein